MIAARHEESPISGHRDGERVTTARVMLADGDRYLLRFEDGGETVAARAASCLLAPCPGDRVLVARVPEAFVLAVLERDSRRPAEVVFDGDAAIRSRKGRLELQANEGVKVTTKAFQVLSQSMSLAGGRAEVLFGELHAVAAKARASFDEAGVVAKTYDLVADRIAERAERVYRFVSQLDQLRARHFDYRAEHCAQIKGENTVIVASQVARMDGEQVHIG